MGKACPGDKDTEEGRLIGDYVLGPRIGWGSFAVVWKSRHRRTGMEVAIKEIDKRHLHSSRDNLLKEISILSNIRHPNIICLFEAIQTEDRIYLVLEYCDGGDLAAYIHRHGKVSETLARHFMRQLAIGLRVLNENRLIHRDLKPQNLLLSNTEATPLLKIGDFGFARYLTDQGLAHTLCGSPLYMAPEIIQNKQYDGKADLWSAGAILYQLVTGKPPFDGDTQLQLFQNILASSKLQFSEDALEQLRPDCVDLCRSLLRQNPVERLTFEEFFNHKFLTERVDPSANSSANYNKIKHEKRHANSSSSQIDHGNTSHRSGIQSFMSNILIEQPRNHLKVTDSLDSIEKDYVLVSSHFTSTETLSCFLDKSMLSGSASGIFCFLPLKSDCDVGLTLQPEDQVDAFSYRSKNLQNHQDALIELPSTALLPVVHLQTKFQLLHKYICILSELAQMKFNTGLYLESFSIELVIIAMWKEALKVCSSSLAYVVEDDFCENSLCDRSVKSPDKSICTKENAIAPSDSRKSVDFTRPQTVSWWAEQEFIAAFDRAEKLSYHVKSLDGNVKMPDAMEVIFQTALEVGKSGGVDELMGNKSSAVVAYSKAKLLMSFILGEAALLPLDPPFSSSPADRERIKGYIANFESRESIFQMSELFQ